MSVLAQSKLHREMCHKKRKTNAALLRTDFEQCSKHVVNRQAASSGHDAPSEPADPSAGPIHHGGEGQLAMPSNSAEVLSPPSPHSHSKYAGPAANEDDQTPGWRQATLEPPAYNIAIGCRNPTRIPPMF
jgi:hypothetical protein